MNMSQKAQELRAAETAHRLTTASTNNDQRLRAEDGRPITSAAAVHLHGQRRRAYGMGGKPRDPGGDPTNQLARRRWEKEEAARVAARAETSAHALGQAVDG